MTDQTVGLPTGSARPLSVALRRRQAVAASRALPTDGLGADSPGCRRPDPTLLGRRRRRSRTFCSPRPSPWRWSALAVLLSRRAFFAATLTASLVVVVVVTASAKRATHEHGPARLRHLLLSRLLVDGELPLERPPPLPRRARGRAPGRRLGGRGSPIAPTPPACPAAGPPWRCCSASALPGTAPTPRASGATCSSTTRTSTSRRSTPPGARRSRRCGAERCWRRRRDRPWRGPRSPFRPRAAPRPSRRTSS